MNDEGTKIIEGTYRGQKGFTHFFNEETGNVVIKKSKGGDFVSGWKLSNEQKLNLLKHGNLQ